MFDSWGGDDVVFVPWYIVAFVQHMDQILFILLEFLGIKRMDLKSNCGHHDGNRFSSGTAIQEDEQEEEFGKGNLESSSQD